MTKVNHDIEFAKLKKRLDHVGSINEKIALLEKLIELHPRDSKSLTLRRRYKETLDTLRVKRKTGRGGVGSPYDAIGFRRQVLLVGEANTGRSTLLARLTGSPVPIEEAPFTTYRPAVQMMHHKDVPIQVVEVPPLYVGDSDPAKYRFIRNSDVLCVCARTVEDVKSTVRQLENHLVVLRNSPLPSDAKHKQRPGEEVVEKPALVAGWQTSMAGVDLDTIDINDTESVSRQIYFLLNIKRMFCMRHGEIEGKPLVFPADQQVTVSDFAGSLDKRMREGLSKARVVEGDATMPRGQIVGLDHKLGDGDKVELVGLR
jgi:ribosome-interacting GTPase 1